MKVQKRSKKRKDRRKTNSGAFNANDVKQEPSPDEDQSKVNDRESVLIEQKSPKSKPKVVVPSPVGKFSEIAQDVNFF